MAAHLDTPDRAISAPAAPGNDGFVRIEAGAAVDEFGVDGIGLVVSRYQRSADGWTATFTIVAEGVEDLALVHRLSAPTLAEARRAVPRAVALLAGRSVDAAVPPLTRL